VGRLWIEYLCKRVVICNLLSNGAFLTFAQGDLAYKIYALSDDDNKQSVGVIDAGVEDLSILKLSAMNTARNGEEIL
jgi:hypothetical protein